jgi:hypothetical protein
LKNDGTISVAIPNGKYACFSATDIATANKKIGDITNVDLTVGAAVENLQIYSIYLNDS